MAGSAAKQRRVKCCRQRLHGGGEHLGALVGRRPICIYDEVLLTFVDGLQRSSRSNVDDPANGNLVALWRITEKHRQTAGENDEGFLLLVVHVTLASRPRLVAPDVRATVPKADPRLQFGDVSSRLAGFVRAGEPLKLFWQNDRELHTATPDGTSPATATLSA